MNTPVHGNHREREILDELRTQGGSCRIQVLATRLGVSEETIRRNVKNLVKSEIVRKVHGGVHLNESHIELSFNRRMAENPDAKRTIGAAMAKLIDSGDTLFLDIGSTTAFIAKSLSSHNDLFVVTNSVTVAQTLVGQNNNRMFLAGGELRTHDAGAFGPEALEFVRQFNVQYAVLSVAAINAAAGFMVHDMREAIFSREIIEHAKVRVVAADSAKFGKSAPIILKEPSAFDLLVTDKTPPKNILQFLEENDIDLIVGD